DAIMKQRGPQTDKQRENLTASEAMQRELNEWWETGFVPKEVVKPREEMPRPNPPTPPVEESRPVNIVRPATGHGNLITGTLVDKNDGLPIIGATVVIKGTNSGVQTD